MPTRQISFGPYQAESQELQRRRQIAQALQTQGMAPGSTGRMVGELFVPESPLAGVAKILQTALGTRQLGQVGEEEKALTERIGQDRSQALAQALQLAKGIPEISNEMGPGRPAMPGDPTSAVTGLVSSGDPVQAQMAQLIAQLQPKPQGPMSLAPGATAFDPGTRQPIYTAPSRAEKPAERWSEPRMMSGALVQQNEATGEIRTAVGRPPREPSMESKPPPGYRYTQAGDLQAIPGGPADTKIQGQLNQDTASLQQSESALDRLAVAANAVKEHPGLKRVTGLMGAIPNIPGSAAANAEAQLHTLKAQTGFAVLQDMRNASKTGGALGQITERELAFLQNALAALDKAQSTEEMQKSLQQIISFAGESKGRLRNAFNMKHKSENLQPTTATGQLGLTPEEQQELEALRSRFGKR